MNGMPAANLDRFTTLAGQNRLALLLFGLGKGYLCGINVFKVREVLRCPPLTALPGMHAWVRGATTYRGREITVVDLFASLGHPLLDNPAQGHLLVTEFNGSVQGFLVGEVDRLVHVPVDSVAPPTLGLDTQARYSLLTRVDEQLVGIVDVEQVLAEVGGVTATPAVLARKPVLTGKVLSGQHVLVVDDSALARRKMGEVLALIGVKVEFAADGAEALIALQHSLEHGRSRFDLLITDIEMPKLDGYALTRSVRENKDWAGMPILMHSSLSGNFSGERARSVGADRFLTKFDADALAEMVSSMLGETLNKPQAGSQ